MPRPKGSNRAHSTAARKTEEWKWASREQFEAWKYGPYPLCLSGGYGAGKSVIACRKILRLCDAFPGYRVVIARRRWVHLKETTMSTFFKVCPPILYDRGRRSDTDKTLDLNNGSRIMWMHLEDDAEVANVIPGLEINAFFIDQAEEVQEEIYDKLSGRLGRWDRAEVPQAILDLEARRGKEWKWLTTEGKPMPPSYAIIACNPDHELHWIYRRFHPDSIERMEKRIPEIDDKTRQPTGNALSYADLGYKMIQMPSTGNRFLPKSNLNQLLAQDESFKRRFVRGEWGIPEGTIHDPHPSSFVPGTPDLLQWILATCTLHRTMDYGDSSPTAVLWWGVDGNGNVICYREYYQPNKLISDHRKEVAALSENERYQFQLADPSIFVKMQAAKGGRWCVADEWSDQKVSPQSAVFWQPADNNELGTRNRINEYLRFDPNRINPFTKKAGSPRLFFLTKNEEYRQGAFFAVREMRAQRREKIGADLGKPVFSDDRDERVPDHAYDCLRYFIASRPPVALEAGPGLNPMSFKAVHDNLKKFQRRGGPRMLAKLARKVA